MMIKEKRFTVIGAGHGGKAMAADLSARGFPVTLYNRTPARIAEITLRSDIELERENGTICTGHLEHATSNITEALRDGISIAEFPTTVQAATLAHERGMYNVMGSPNLVRGGSHSGNVSAGELAASGILHALSSDYMPISLLHGALMLADEHGYSVPAAIATVSTNVAEMLGFHDRGEIAAGKRADLVLVNGNPLERIAAISDLRAVILEGVPLVRTPLTAVEADDSVTRL